MTFSQENLKVTLSQVNNNEVEVQLDNATHIQYYRAGREIQATLDENGKFRIRLGAGEGIFVIPYKES